MGDEARRSRLTFICTPHVLSCFRLCVLSGISEADVKKWRYAIAQLNTDPFGKPREAGKSVTEARCIVHVFFVCTVLFVCYIGAGMGRREKSRRGHDKKERNDSTNRASQQHNEKVPWM